MLKHSTAPASPRSGEGTGTVPSQAVSGDLSNQVLSSILGLLVKLNNSVESLNKNVENLNKNVENMNGNVENLNNTVSVGFSGLEKKLDGLQLAVITTVKSQSPLSCTFLFMNCPLFMRMLKAKESSSQLTDNSSYLILLQLREICSVKV